MAIQSSMEYWAEETGRILRLLQGQEFVGLPTGFSGIDQHLRGLMRGATTLLAGAPGLGKTSFVTNIVRRNMDYNNIDPEHQRILVVSAEMGEILWVQRVVSMMLGVPQGLLALGGSAPRKIWSGRESKMVSLSKDTDLFSLIDAALEQIAQWPVQLMGSGAVSTHTIEQELYRLRNKERLDVPLVIVDHAAMLADVGDTDSATSRPDNLCQRFDDLAQTYDSHFLVIWPITKTGFAGKDMPSYNHLRGSAMPAYQAANVLMLHSPYLMEMVMGDRRGLTEEVPIQVGIQKNRYFGVQETVEIPFIPAIGRYNEEPTEDWADRYRQYRCPVTTTQAELEGGVAGAPGDITRGVSDTSGQEDGILGSTIRFQQLLHRASE